MSENKLLNRKIAIQLKEELFIKNHLLKTNTNLYSHVATGFDDLRNHLDILSYIDKGIKETKYDILLRKEDTKQGQVLKLLTEDDVTRIKNRFLSNDNIHMYIRQSFENNKRTYIMIDDLNHESLELMFNNGFEPSLVTETSKDNHQAVITFSKAMPMSFISHAHFLLKIIFNADMLCDCHDQFMRMSGTKNVKDKYETMFITRVSHYNKQPFSMHDNFVKTIDATSQLILNDQSDITSEIINRRINDFIVRGFKL